MGFESAVSVQTGDREWSQVRCLELRLAGKAIAEIADELNLGEATVRQQLRRAYRDIQAPLVAELRSVELARLDEAHRSIWDRVKEGNLVAIDRFLKISRARRELMGLDRPVGDNDSDDGPKHTIIEILPKPPEDSAAPDPTLAPPTEGVAGGDASDRDGGWNRIGKDLVRAEVAAPEAHEVSG